MCTHESVQYSRGCAVPVRHTCSTREENFIHLQFIESHSRILRVCLTGTAGMADGYCTYFIHGGVQTVAMSIDMHLLRSGGKLFLPHIFLMQDVCPAMFASKTQIILRMGRIEPATSRLEIECFDSFHFPERSFLCCSRRSEPPPHALGSKPYN